MATNPFTKIVASRKAEAAKESAHHPADEHTAPAAATVTRSAGSTALDHAAGARAEEQAQSALRDGDDRHTTQTPDNTPPPAHTATGAAGSTDDTGNPNHPFTTDLNSELAGAEAAANGQLQHLADLAGIQSGDPTGGSGAPQSPADRLTHGGSAGTDPRQSARQAATDPEDRGKGADAFAALQGDLRDQVTGHDGTDAMTDALTGVLNEAASHSTSPLNVADALTDAQNSVTPADLAKAAAKAGVTPPGTNEFTGAEGEKEEGGDDGPGEPDNSAPPAATTPPPKEDKGFIDHLKDVFTHAAEKQADDLGKIDGGGSVGTTTVFQAQEQQGIKNLETAAGKTLGGFAHGGDGKDGGGAKDSLPPDSGLDAPPTAAQIAFAKALNDITHTGPAFHNPGNVDPGPEGDTSGTSTGPVSSGVLAANTGVAGEHRLLGDPGTVNGGISDGPGATGHLPAGGTIGHGPTGEPGDAQSGIVQDDGNAVHGSAHDTGPGGEHFGPSDSLGAAPPTSPDDSSSNSDDSSDDSGHLSLDPALVAQFEHAHLFPLDTPDQDD